MRRVTSRLKGLARLGGGAVAAGLLMGAAASSPVPPDPAGGFAAALGPVHGPESTVVCEAGRSRIDRAFARWTGAVRDRRDARAPGTPAGEVAAVVRDIFALKHVADELLDGGYRELHDYDRDRFSNALVRAIEGELLPYFQAQDELPALRPANEEWSAENGTVQARYWLIEPDSRDWFTIRLVEEDGACRIADLVKGSRSLAGRLEGRVERLLDEYSFAYMVAALGGYEEVILEDFEDQEVGELPRKWSWKDKDDDKRKPYRVRSENGNRYLEATDEGESVILGREIEWNVHEYPYISFRVRVNRIPEGGDERDDDKVDSAAGIYVTLNKKLFGKIPESVKYVWSSTLPVGTAVQRDGIGRPWQVVFGSGREGLGQWRTYVFDVREAFRKTFGNDPPARALGIGVLSDANSLDSRAYADYDDFRALRSAPPDVTSGVIEIVPPVKD